MIKRPLTKKLLWLSFISLTQISFGQSVTRQWIEENLEAIRKDFPAPTVHARNLFHTSAAMYDAWAAYDSTAVGIFHNETATAVDIEAARAEAISYAAHAVLEARYAGAVGGINSLISFEARMSSLGYSLTDNTIGDSPSAVGNRVASSILAAANSDNSNEENNYIDTTGYTPVNDPLLLFGPPPSIIATNPNRWQPLKFEKAQTQNGQEASDTQIFIGAQWGNVRSFALEGTPENGLYPNLDPGAPPYLNGVGDADYKANAVQVIEFSSKLDPSSTETIDISPGAAGSNNTLGQNDGIGHSSNPSTNAPYAPNVVKLGDYGRVISEFWADGPNSETPPGHWNEIANGAMDHPAFEKRIGGTGPIVNDLEFDTKLYVSLNAGLHDTAIAVWGIKAAYDYVRPITAIRHLCLKGQSSDSNLPNYDPEGIPLVSGLIELSTSASTAVGERHEGFPEDLLLIKAWGGEPLDPKTEFGGTIWFPGDAWLPYQRNTFVTPAFAGYVSGHSGFSRCAAEILTSFTGSAFFPGGLGTHAVPMGSADPDFEGDLEFEFGPSTDITLQWGTYYDAADEAGLSRIYGGIHVAPDDGPGRIIGANVAATALDRISKYFDGSILDNLAVSITDLGDDRMISWPNVAGYTYQLKSSATLDSASFMPLGTSSSSVERFGDYMHPKNISGPKRFYIVERSAP